MDIRGESKRKSFNQRRDRDDLLAWPWLGLALVLFIVATLGVWRQDPLPAPSDREPSSASLWDQFSSPIETNPQLRLVTLAVGLRSVFFTENSLRGWTVGSSGTILATVNGGRTWNPQTSNTTETINSVNFQQDGLHGWAVGLAGTILATVDGGRTWNPQTSNTTNHLHSVNFQQDVDSRDKLSQIPIEY